MGIAAHPTANLALPAAPAGTLERLRCALLWFTGFAGAFVFIEPSPYELVSILAIGVFALTGLTLNAALMPLALLLVLCNLGFSIAVVPVIGEPRTLIWVLVSWYLAGTAIFFAAMLAQNTGPRLDALLRGYMMAALVAALAGIAGYFQLIPGLSEHLTRFGRAQGTFNDPNVLGAFLIPPALFAMQRMLAGGTRDILRGGVLLGIFLVAILLSFSRAAWGLVVLGGLMLMALTFVTSSSQRERLRIIAVAIGGAAALALLVVAILSMDAVGDLFRERASLQQSYDSGPMGRFGRYVPAFLLILETPLGIGPLQFFKYFPEDPHNSYLNTFVVGGWMSGLSYAAMVLITLVAGFRHAFVATPWRPAYLVVFTAFVGLAVESVIIDTDHWRHYFLVLGVQWGLIVATARYRRNRTLSRLAAKDHPAAAA